MQIKVTAPSPDLYRVHAAFPAQAGAVAYALPPAHAAAFGADPVSYTHLDVYKRQPQKSRQ